MGKYDYQKSYSRQIESIAILICSFYSLTELIIGYNNGWNLFGQAVVLCGMIVYWICFLGQYKTYEVRVYITSIIAQITSVIRISGNPITNLVFFVLCLNKYIPAIPPIPPPRKTNVNNVDSFILHFPFFAFCLSMYIAKKDIIQAPTIQNIHSPY